METIQQEDVLIKLKALAEDSSLKIIRLLHEREYTVGELAETVELVEPTVSHHLARLREAGLVTLRMAGNQRYYRANEQGLANFKKEVASIERFPEIPAPVVSDDRWIAELGWSAEDQAILRAHTSNGRLTHLTNKQKKTVVVLRWLATKFQPEKLYSEVEVNTIIKSVYEEDYVSLRRDLVDYGYLRRERGGGQYWLAPADDASQPK